MPRSAYALHRTVVLVLGIAVTARADTIFYRAESGQKPKEEVTVKGETATEVEFVPQGAKTSRTDPSFDVEYIEYDDAPDDYRKGIAFFRQGKWYDARRHLATALKEVLTMEANTASDEPYKVRPWWAKQYLNFYLAECHRERGPRQAEEFDDAIEKYDAVLALTPPSRFTGDAMVGKARCLAAKGKLPDALKILEDVISRANAKSIAPHHVAAALLARAECQQAAGAHAAAAGDYHRLAEEIATSHPDRAVRYKLAAAFAQIDAGNASGARSDFESLKRSFPNSSLAQAGGNNGLGMLALASGDFALARETFARTLAFYGSHASEYERALKGMADALRGLGSAETYGADLASQYIRELRDRNPTSLLLEGEAETAPSEIGGDDR